MSAWIAHTLVSTTLLMLAVLAVRRPMAKAFGARVAYALWALPALRMILPPLPGMRTFFVPVLNIGPHVPLQIGLVPPEAVAEQIVLPPDMLLAIKAPPPAPWLGWTEVLLALWLGGALLWFGWQLLRYRHFVTRAVGAAYLLGRECGVEVLVSERVGGPVASGILRRRIFLPADFTTRYTSAERRQALLHEGAHHDRHDLLANLAGLAVLALHWWNPIAHAAYRAFRADQELACDATVLAAADAQDRYAYGSALVKSSCARTPAAACALDRATEIKRRLTMIKRGRVAGLRRGGGVVLALATIGAGLTLTASGDAAVEHIQRIALPALPALPEPVAPPEAVAPPAMPFTFDRDGMRDRAREEARHARDAARAARAAGMRAAEAGQTAAAEGRHAAIAGAEAARLSRQPLATARASLAARCAAQGRPVAAGERDWGRLAMCDPAAFRAELNRSIAEATARADSHVAFAQRMAERARAHAEAVTERVRARAEADRWQDR